MVWNVAPWPRARKKTLWATSRNVFSTTLHSDTSRSKVRSTLIDFGSGRSSTGSSSNPRAMAQSQIEFLPSIFFRLAPGKRASSPIVRTPERSRSCAVFTPTPLIFVTGSGSRNRVTSSERTTFKPSGFARSDAILATDLLGPAPIVHANPPRSRTAAFTRAAYSAAPPAADIECVHVHVENHTRHAAPSARRSKDLANRRGSLHTELVAFRILHDDAILLGIVPDALLRRPKSENPFDLGVDAFHPFLRRNLSSTGNVDIEMQAVLLLLRRVPLRGVDPRAHPLPIDHLNRTVSTCFPQFPLP